MIEKPGISFSLKLFMLFLIAMLCGLVFSGCSRGYDTDGIRDYLEEKYDFGKFTVDKDPKETEDSEGYTDKLWSVRVKNGPGFEFSVFENRMSGLFGVQSSLRDDFIDVVMAYLWEDFEDGGLLNFVEEEDFDGLKNVKFEQSYGSRTELEEVIEAAEAFGEYVSDEGFEADMQVAVELEDIFGYPLTDSRVGDIWYTLSDDPEETKTDALNKYIRYCLSFGLEEELSQFTEEEITGAVNAGSYRVGVAGDDGKMDYYDDLCGTSYGAGFGLLYQILEREGYSVIGDYRHYSFIGANGIEYEVSYDFNEPDADGESRNFYYYRNGTRLETSNAHTAAFLPRDIEEMTGLELNIGRITQ